MSKDNKVSAINTRSKTKLHLVVDNNKFEPPHRSTDIFDDPFRRKPTVSRSPVNSPIVTAIEEDDTTPGVVSGISLSSEDLDQDLNEREKLEERRTQHISDLGPIRKEDYEKPRT